MSTEEIGEIGRLEEMGNKFTDEYKLHISGLELKGIQIYHVESRNISFIF